jgi:hypothetical protein
MGYGNGPVLRFPLRWSFGLGAHTNLANGIFVLASVDLGNDPDFWLPIWLVRVSSFDNLFCRSNGWQAR